MIRRAGQVEFVRWFGPLIAVLRDLGGSASPREAIDRIAEAEKVPDELRNTILKSGQERFYNQVHWARQYLVWEGLIESGRRGVWALTPAGRKSSLSADDARAIFLRQVKRQAGLRKQSEGETGATVADDAVYDIDLPFYEQFE